MNTRINTVFRRRDILGVTDTRDTAEYFHRALKIRVWSIGSPNALPTLFASRQVRLVLVLGLTHPENSWQEPASVLTTSLNRRGIYTMWYYAPEEYRCWKDWRHDWEHKHVPDLDKILATVDLVLDPFDKMRDELG